MSGRQLNSFNIRFRQSLLWLSIFIQIVKARDLALTLKKSREYRYT